MKNKKKIEIKKITPKKKLIIMILVNIITWGGSMFYFGNQTYDFFSKVKQESQLNIKNENKSDFNDNKWQKHLGSFLRNDSDPNYFGLASTSDKGLIKFHNSFSERQFIVFEFTPLSENSANIIIHINDLYEVVIGDNDYKTLTLKAREGWNGPWKIIPNKEGQLKKEMYTGIKKNTDVIIRMLTYCQMDEKYFTRLEIKFKAEQIEMGENQFLVSEYVFNPPFQNCRPFDVSVGLINPNHQSDISARFLAFEIKK